MPRSQPLPRPSERFALIGSVFYLLAPEGVGRSVLVQRLGRLLAVPVTGRNLRSVRAIVALARAVAG